MSINKTFTAFCALLIVSLNSVGRDFTALDFSDAVGRYVGEFQVAEAASCSYTYKNYLDGFYLVSAEYYCGFQTNVYTFKKANFVKRHLILKTAMKKGYCTDLNLELNRDQTITIQNPCTKVSTNLVRTK